MKFIKIPDELTTEYASQVLEINGHAKAAEEIHPTDCWDEICATLERHNLFEWALEYLRKAPGDRAEALYWCAYKGWLKPKEAVKLIKKAPGDRKQAVKLIRDAPGDRAFALYRCKEMGWLEEEE